MPVTPLPCFMKLSLESSSACGVALLRIQTLTTDPSLELEELNREWPTSKARAAAQAAAADGADDKVKVDKEDDPKVDKIMVESESSSSRAAPSSSSSSSSTATPSAATTCAHCGKCKYCGK